jgi:hypothetical protein
VSFPLGISFCAQISGGQNHRLIPRLRSFDADENPLSNSAAKGAIFKNYPKHIQCQFFFPFLYIFFHIYQQSRCCDAAFSTSAPIELIFPRGNRGRIERAVSSIFLTSPDSVRRDIAPRQSIAALTAPDFRLHSSGRYVEKSFPCPHRSEV